MGAPAFQKEATVEARDDEKEWCPGSVTNIAYKNGGFKYTVRLDKGRTLRELSANKIRHPKKEKKQTVPKPTPGRDILVDADFNSQTPGNTIPRETEDGKQREAGRQKQKKQKDKREEALDQLQNFCPDRNRCQEAWEKFPNQAWNVRVQEAGQWLIMNPAGVNLQKENAPQPTPEHVLPERTPTPPVQPEPTPEPVLPEATPEPALPLYLDPAPLQRAVPAPLGKIPCPNPKCKGKRVKKRGWM